MSENMKKFGLEFVFEDKATKHIERLITDQAKLQSQLRTTVDVMLDFQASAELIDTKKARNELRMLQGAYQNLNKVLQQTNALTGKSVGANQLGKQASSGIKAQMDSQKLVQQTLKNQNEQLKGLRLQAQISKENASAQRVYAGTQKINLQRELMQNRLQGNSAFSFDNSKLGSMGSFVSSILPKGGILGAMSSMGTVGKVFSGVGMVTKGVIGVMGKLGGAIGNVIGHLGHFATSMAGIITLMAAYKLGQSTIGQAMDYQYDWKLMETMAKYKKNPQMMEGMQGYVTKRAIDSPMFGESDYIPVLRVATAFSKSSDELKSVLKLAERMAIMDPVQGMQGASVSIQEMASGQFESIRKRFELSQADTGRLKKYQNDVGKMMEELDHILTEKGFGDALIDDMSTTAKAKFQRIKEIIGKSFRDAGIMALESISPLFDKINGFFDSLEGQNMVFGLKQSFADATAFIINELINLQPFFEQMQPVVSSLGDLMRDSVAPAFHNFVDWLAGDGGYWISSTLQTGIDLLGQIIDTVNYLSPAFELAFNVALNVIGLVNSALGGLLSLVNSILGGLSSIGSHDFSGYANNVESATKSSGRRTSPKLAIGSPYIPQDDYPVLLHKGERVLTAQQNKQYNNGDTKGVNLGKLADTLIVREDADIDKIVNKLVKKIQEERFATVKTWG